MTSCEKHKIENWNMPINWNLTINVNPKKWEKQKTWMFFIFKVCKVSKPFFFAAPYSSSETLEVSFPSLEVLDLSLVEEEGFDFLGFSIWRLLIKNFRASLDGWVKHTNQQEQTT